MVGCATSGSTDPRDDSFITSARCAFTDDCENYVDDKERDLIAERDKSRQLEAERVSADTDLANTRAQVDTMRASLNELDVSISSLREQAELATAEAASSRDEIARLQSELDQLQIETQETEDDVLKETISVETAEIQRTSLINRRDELEALLQSILASE